jgi:hypothetical protein
MHGMLSLKMNDAAVRSLGVLAGLAAALPDSLDRDDRFVPVSLDGRDRSIPA